AALARPPRNLAAALVDAHARHSFPVHRKHGRLDGSGAWAAAVDRLRAHAHRRRFLTACRSRRYRLHHAGLLRPLRRRVAAVPLPGWTRDRPRPGARHTGAAVRGHARSRFHGEGTVIPFWYGVVAVMLSVYVVLDGFDFGAGILHLFVARTDRERREVLAAIGPVWDGNEVWLIASGGTLVFAFPRAYATGFSGFYLPLMMVLWLLILRGLSIEFRSHNENPLWRSFWDGTFAFSSTLMAVVLGAALGNVIRGVPIGAVVSLVFVFVNVRQRRELPAFLASAGFIVCLLAATAAGMYPNLLISTVNPAYAVTVANGAAGGQGMAVGLIWWTMALALAVG